MVRSFPAIVNRELLKWARIYAGLDVDYVAEKTGLDVHSLSRWESGPEYPTISQLRLLAKVFHFPIAVFYLSEPPPLKAIRPKDRRFLPESEFAELSPELDYEFRKVSERREITLELLANLGSPPKQFGLTTTFQIPPEELGWEIRNMLNIAVEKQYAWRDARLAFNSWRQKLEALDILVFQTTDVSLSQMRGFSLFHDVLPIISVNRKDSYAARSFTLMHELVHLMMRMESLCDMKEEISDHSDDDQFTEIFCNSVAACTLVPRDALFSNDNLKCAQELTESGDKAIRELSLRFSVSREVIVRRMLTLGLVNEDFYTIKREQYYNEFTKRVPSKQGHVNPVLDLLSYAGKPFVTLALENFNRGNITTSDISDYLGIKIKHLDSLQDSVSGA